MLNLITPTKSFLPPKVTYSQISRVRMWTTLVGGGGARQRAGSLFYLPLDP